MSLPQQAKLVYNQVKSTWGGPIMEEQQWLTTKFIADSLQLSEDSIRTYIREGELKAYKFGHVYRVKKEDYLEWLKKHEAGQDRKGKEEKE